MCSKAIYAMDPKAKLEKRVFHMACFVCADCGKPLTGTVSRWVDDTLVCGLHARQRDRAAGRAPQRKHTRSRSRTIGEPSSRFKRLSQNLSDLAGVPSFTTSTTASQSTPDANPPPDDGVVVVPVVNVDTENPPSEATVERSSIGRGSRGRRSIRDNVFAQSEQQADGVAPSPDTAVGKARATTLGSAGRVGRSKTLGRSGGRRRPGIAGMFATARTPGGNRSPSPSRGRGPDFAAASDETSPVVGRTATIGRTGGDACVACGEAIGGKFLRLPEGRYHPDCLQCEACQTTLKGAYAEVEGKRYCRACGDAAANQGFQQAYDDDGDASTCAGGLFGKAC